MKRTKSPRPRETERTEETHDKQDKEAKEFLSQGESEIRSERVSDVSHDADEVPPLATRVASLQEAVDLAIAADLGENCLFVFARALLAFEVFRKSKLPAAERENAFRLWWACARPLLRKDADWDEYRFMFYDAVKNAKTPLGANPLKEAISRAEREAPPPEADRYASPRLKRLVTVCYQLQRLQGHCDIFLGLRDAMSITESKSLRQAGQMLDGLIHDGILERTFKGTPGGFHASRYRFKFASPPATSSPT